MDSHRGGSLPPDFATVALYEQRSGFRYANEMRLLDVWLILTRRKLIIGSMFFLSLAIGSSYAFLSPHLYSYTTLVEIGTNGRGELLEPLETIRTKLADGYIARILQEHMVKNPSDTARYEIITDVPKNSNVLLLRSKGTAEQERTYATLHDAVVARLKQDHQRVQKLLRDDMQARLKMRERGLTDLKEKGKLLEAQLKRPGDKRDLPARELAFLTTLTLVDRQRAQAEMLAQIDNIRSHLALMRETGATGSPMRSANPVGPGKKTTVILSSVTGIFLGLLAALYVDFVAGVRARVARGDQPRDDGSAPLS